MAYQLLENPVLHIHYFDKPGIEYRKKGRLLNDVEKAKYKKFFKGVNNI